MFAGVQKVCTTTNLASWRRLLFGIAFDFSSIADTARVALDR
jgi:hypothetical protein